MTFSFEQKTQVGTSSDALTGANQVITIPISTKSDVLIAQLNGSIISKLQDKGAFIELKTDTASYLLPVNAIDFSTLTEQFGSDFNLEDIKLEIEISTPSNNMISIVNQSLYKAGLTLSSAQWILKLDLNTVMKE